MPSFVISAPVCYASSSHDGQGFGNLPGLQVEASGNAQADAKPERKHYKRVNKQ